jgi:hypothetical protein
MNGNLIDLACAAREVLLVRCASAPDPKRPGHEALACPQSQAETDAQDAPGLALRRMRLECVRNRTLMSVRRKEGETGSCT